MQCGREKRTERTVSLLSQNIKIPHHQMEFLSCRISQDRQKEDIFTKHIIHFHWTWVRPIIVEGLKGRLDKFMYKIGLSVTMGYDDWTEL